MFNLIIGKSHERSPSVSTSVQDAVKKSQGSPDGPVSFFFFLPCLAREKKMFATALKRLFFEDHLKMMPKVYSSILEHPHLFIYDMLTLLVFQRLQESKSCLPSLPLRGRYC